MKKLLYPLVFALSAFLLIYSCSSEEDATPPPVPTPIVKYTISLSAGEGGSVSTTGGQYESGQTLNVTATPQAEYVFKSWSDGNTNATRTITVSSNTNLTATFEKKKYPLTINIQGEGSVTEEIVSTGKTTEYGSGTTVRLTAIPFGEWIGFDGWSGDIDSKENSIEILIDKPTNITVDFSETSVIVNKTTTYVDTNVEFWDVRQAFYLIGGVFPYKSGDDFYAFYPGAAEYTSDGNKIKDSKDNIPPKPSHIIKRVDGKWEYYKTDDTAKFWGARNYEIDGKYVAVGDGNEIGQDMTEWNGDLFFGEIKSEGEIMWTRVNSIDNRLYCHGTTIGDLNGDGLMDIGIAPGKWRPDLDKWQLQFFTQNDNGLFTNNENTPISYGFYGDVEGLCPPFTLDFVDLFGDNKDEIILADYGVCNNEYEKANQIQIYKFNTLTNKYEKKFESSAGTVFYDNDMGATSIKVYDFNNDGIKDISVARENQFENAFEVWLGNGDETYSLNYATPVWKQDELQFREFTLLDVNNDGYMDIVLRPFQYGKLYRNNPVPGDVPKNNGIMLHNLIMINDGTGKFNSYNKEKLIIENINVDSIHPYMDNGTLHFVGTFTDEERAFYLDTFDFKVRILD